MDKEKRKELKMNICNKRKKKNATRYKLLVYKNIKT